ncbi:uncharacterized protein LOC120068987 isoform X1 [Benincasa hispida]|uniref:uncharacterized protein LOC120068987 isoform X1 n=1 Tax=Benincasa hispida TaxID=102211 RepID=UPI001900CC80|nr:uncharacterized protein LOC120068987 isoform X1 [Benincasa hispida]XP_038876568.1 uncharacterized protein LOC120068987 isoform X1 [Benincasa hispida]XP_038876577.1 uncharacterized protein LOC120068987 isoform X1 [Benincasa hispida]XP_038876587.1 uncharacterized protein LOC120068987 isoform X1 [Benincasa hispida]XP_038876594.1 uncharacterized protein LOC120068987 isoform X1 [Benincasa hispida]
MLKSLDESENPDNKPNEKGVLICAQDVSRMSSPGHFDQSNCEVLAASFQQLSFGVHEEVNGLSILNLKPPLSRPHNCQMRKKLLILDINGVLVDIVSPPPKERKADINIARHAVFKRPFYLDFMKFCFERFEIGIWSSRNRKNVSRMVDYLMGDMKHGLLFCWDLSHCTASEFYTVEKKHKRLVFKQLRKVWEKQDPNLPWKQGEYNESNTVLVDDSPYKSLLNPVCSFIFWIVKDYNQWMVFMFQSRFILPFLISDLDTQVFSDIVSSLNVHSCSQTLQFFHIPTRFWMKKILHLVQEGILEFI